MSKHYDKVLQLAKHYHKDEWVVHANIPGYSIIDLPNLKHIPDLFIMKPGFPSCIILVETDDSLYSDEGKEIRLALKLYASANDYEFKRFNVDKS